jgi:hypothetical protein
MDLLTRLPGIGPWLRDIGGPVMSVVVLMVAGVRLLIQTRTA